MIASNNNKLNHLDTEPNSETCLARIEMNFFQALALATKEHRSYFIMDNRMQQNMLLHGTANMLISKTPLNNVIHVVGDHLGALALHAKQLAMIYMYTYIYKMVCLSELSMVSYSTARSRSIG